MASAKVLLKSATAGFEEKGDLLVTVSPTNPGSGIQINLTSSVMLHFGDHIKEFITKTVKEAGFNDVLLEIKDKGAWDYAIKARVSAALERGMKND